MSKRWFFLLAAPALLALLMTPGPGMSQFYGGRSFGGYASSYRGGYSYYPGYSGYGIGYGRGYYSPGLYSGSYYAPRYYGSTWGYAQPYYPATGYYSSGLYAPAYAPPVIVPSSYPSYYPSEPSRPEVVTGDAPATVEVRLPAGAELWFGSFRPSQTGSTRVFESPTLTAGRSYTYEVRARWNQDGRLVDQTRIVEVFAGRVAKVDFMTAGRVEKAPAPRERTGASPPPDPTPPPTSEPPR